MAKNNSKKFLLEFFKDCIIEDKGSLLIISGVQTEFEEFIGKKAPYKFVFDINAHNTYKDSELIMQGSYFLLAIRDYLSDKGLTCLLKINIKPDIAKINSKLNLIKYKFIGINSETLSFLYRFSFLSKYQYLNNKKQTINTILIKSQKYSDIDLSKFNLQKGNADIIPEIDIQEFYKKAKELLNEKVSQDVIPLKLILKEKIKKELFRVKNHYHKQIHEKDEEVETCANKIKMLESKLKHTAYERDRNILKRMIRESIERLEMLEKKGYRERLKSEEKFHINDEVEKHVLSIKNSLINVTVIYYPIYQLRAISNGKHVVLNYDPILDKII